MDDGRFDAWTRRLGVAFNRRTTLGAGLAAAVAGLAGLEPDEATAAPEAEKCRKLGKRCNRKKHTCCGGGKCRGRHCVCRGKKKECNGACIPVGDCCTNADCPNGTCVRGVCVAEPVPCSPDDCEGCCDSGVCKRGTTANACGTGGVACVACGTNESCNGTACVCQAPFTTCGAACVDTNTDEGNCGACGTQCAGNETCRDSQCVVLVTPSNLNGWVNELPPQTNTNYLPVSFVSGPANPPLGSGSAKFAIDSSGSSRVSILYPALADTKLSSLTALRYSTYMENGGAGNVIVPAIKLPSDTGLANPAFTTFIYEPVYSGGSGTVQPSTWQSWDALSNAARWWSSRDIPDPNNSGQFLMCNPNGSNAGTQACAGKLFVPWSVVLQAAPDAELNAGGIQIETGSGAANAIGYTDALVVNGTTFDFDPDAQGATGKSGQASRQVSGNSRKAQRGGRNRR